MGKPCASRVDVERESRRAPVCTMRGVLASLAICKVSTSAYSQAYMPSMVGIISGGHDGLSCGTDFLTGRMLSMLTTRPHDAGRLCCECCDGTGVAGRTVDTSLAFMV